jgi:hypothetical protein
MALRSGQQGGCDRRAGRDIEAGSHADHQAYDYYFSEIHPFTKGLVVEPPGMKKLQDTPEESNDIKSQWTLDQVTDISCLPH